VRKRRLTRRCDEYVYSIHEYLYTNTDALCTVMCSLCDLMYAFQVNCQHTYSRNINDIFGLSWIFVNGDMWTDLWIVARVPSIDM